MRKINYFLIAVVLLLISFLYDKHLIFLIAQVRISIINWLMIIVTNKLVLIIISLLLTLLFLLEKNKRNLIIPLWASIIATWVLVRLIKITISRVRPFEALTLPLIQGVDYAFSALSTSFPSMHAAIIFSLVPFLNKGFPKLKLLWILLAVFISLSRLYIGVHYLSDVIAGAFIGVIISESIIKLEKKYDLTKKWKKILLK